jgi:hypothetical protein
MSNEVMAAIVAASLAGVGALVGLILTLRNEKERWLRDRQLEAYGEVLRHWATFSMEIRRAHADKRGWKYDWGAWSGALIAASLLAPPKVAQQLDRFGAAVDGFLAALEGTDSIRAPASARQLTDAIRPAADAQLVFVNVIRRSFARGHGPLPRWIGGGDGQRLQPTQRTPPPADPEPAASA